MTLSLLLLLSVLLNCRNAPAAARPLKEQGGEIGGGELPSNPKGTFSDDPQPPTPLAPVNPLVTPRVVPTLEEHVMILRAAVRLWLLTPDRPEALLEVGRRLGYELRRENFLEVEMTGDDAPEWLLLYTPDENRPAGMETTGGELFIVRGATVPEIVFEATIPLEIDGALMPPPGLPPTLLAGADISGDALSDLQIYFDSCAVSTGRCFTYFSLFSFHGAVDAPHSLLRDAMSFEPLPGFVQEASQLTIMDVSGDGLPDLQFYADPGQMAGSRPKRGVTVTFQSANGYFIQGPPVLDAARYRYDRLVDGELAWSLGALDEAAIAYADALHGEALPEFHSGEASADERAAVQRVAALRLLQLAQLRGASSDEPLATMRARWPDHPLTRFAEALASAPDLGGRHCAALADTHRETRDEELFGLLADSDYATEPFTIESALCLRGRQPGGEREPPPHMRLKPLPHAPH